MVALVVMSVKAQKVMNIAGIVQENEHFILSPVHAPACRSAPGGQIYWAKPGARALYHLE